jgi:hypothetical protein
MVAKANAAFRQAAIQVVTRALQTGTPVIVWENGRVVELSGQEALARLVQAKPLEGA